MIFSGDDRELLSLVAWEGLHRSGMARVRDEDLAGVGSRPAARALLEIKPTSDKS